MALRLRVIGPQAILLGKTDTKVFGVHGGTVGRSGDNDWVLPDPERYVSGHHARIEYRDGNYWLTDTSSNGTYLNDAKETLAELGTRALKDGDRVRIGDFEIVASIDDSNDFPPDKSAIVAYDGLGSSSAVARSVEDDLDASLDFDALLIKSTSDSSSRPMAPVNAWGQAVAEAAIAPMMSTRPQKAAAAEPAQTPWNLATRRIEPYRNSMRTTAPESPTAATPSSAEQLSGLQALCRGAGIDPASLPVSIQPQVLQLAGQLLREAVLGLMDALQTRTEARTRFRIPQPSIQPSENNPLQFSAGVEEALRKLFEAQGKTAHSSRYLGAVEAVRESFHEMKAHQQAMLAAMHAAFMEFLGQMDPQELQERFDRGLKRSGLLAAATNKTKYWELYAELYQSLNQMPKGELPHLFVEEFGKAYEAKLTELSSRRQRTTASAS